MALPWLRLYTEFASDPKIQILAFEDQRHFIMCLCLKGNRILDTKAETDYRERLIAKALGLDITSAKEAKRRLMDAGLIDKRWHPVKWDSRQFLSDYSTLRVQKFRDKNKGNGNETFQKRYETVQDQNQNQNQNQNRLDKDSESKRPLKMAFSGEKPQESAMDRAESADALQRIRDRIAK